MKELDILSLLLLAIDIREPLLNDNATFGNCADHSAILPDPCSSAHGIPMTFWSLNHRGVAGEVAARDAGTRIVMSTHNVGQARRLADDILFLWHGRLHERAPPSEFFAAPQTREAKAHINGDLIP